VFNDREQEIVEMNSKVPVQDERNKKQIVRQRIETLRDRKKNIRLTTTHNPVRLQLSLPQS